MRIKTDLIKKKRIEIGFTLQQLGEKIGYPSKNASCNMSHLESGRAAFSVIIAKKISETIGLKMDDIINDCLD